MSAVFEVGGKIPSAPGGLVFGTGGGGGGSGFLPAGHFMSKQAMIQVYPRPDTETNTWARHRWAYYDGTTSVQYKIPIGVSFGAFPYVYKLLSGPPGMSIGATFWNTSWGTGANPAFTDAMNAGYGYLQWTPTGSLSGATVSILVTDQQMNTLTITFTVSTSSSTSQFIFIDAVNGNDSTGSGTISAPWQTFTKAFGATGTTTANANTLCYLRAGTYTPPAYAGESGNTVSIMNTAIKPSAMMGFPGDTPPVIDMTGAQFASGETSVADFFAQGLNPNGTQTINSNSRVFWFDGSGNNTARVVFDSNVWSNSGYGSGGGNNATGYFMDGNSTSLTPYIFINNCSETNRESGLPGNNYGGCSFYGAINCLVQACVINQSGLDMDGCFYFKSDVENGCMRGNFVLADNFTHACDWGQAPNSLTLNSESCYNTLLASGGGIFVPQTSGFAYGTLWCYRNTVIGSNGLTSNQPTTNGPYVFDSNAVQSSKAFPSGASIQSDGVNLGSAPTNLLQSSALLNTSTGALLSGFSSYLGQVGAQIA